MLLFEHFFIAPDPGVRGQEDGRLKDRQMEPQCEAVRAALSARRTPASLDELMEETGLAKPALAAALDALHAAGEVMCTRHKKYAVPKTVGCVAGRIQGTRKGYAFLLPFDGSPDVFIGQDDLMGAMHDDEVIAKLIGRPSHGKGHKRQATGEVIEVLRRARETVVGKLERTSHAAFVVPEDRRIAEVCIPQQELHGGQSGQLVVAQILSYAQDGHNATGRVVEILGEAGTAQADVRGIIRHYGLKDAFEPQTLLQAAAVPQQVSPQQSRQKGREDFRHWQTITIDGADARDFDDAISLTQTQQGYELGVHIADVSHYVRPGTALDTEAYRRGHQRLLSGHGAAHAARGAQLRHLLAQCGRGPADALVHHADGSERRGARLPLCARRHPRCAARDVRGRQRHLGAARRRHGAIVWRGDAAAAAHGAAGARLYAAPACARPAWISTWQSPRLRWTNRAARSTCTRTTAALPTR